MVLYIILPIELCANMFYMYTQGSAIGTFKQLEVMGICMQRVLRCKSAMVLSASE
mgnify:CR=1 FL=1